MARILWRSSERASVLAKRLPGRQTHLRYEPLEIHSYGKMVSPNGRCGIVAKRVLASILTNFSAKHPCNLLLHMQQKIARGIWSGAWRGFTSWVRNAG